MNPVPHFVRGRVCPTRGFTLVELLSVIAIIGVLAAILIPLIGKTRASARQSQCISNVRQLTLAMQSYAQDNRRRLPATVDKDTGAQWNRSDGKVWAYVQSNAVASGGNWDNSPGSVFTCPSSESSTSQFNTYGKNSSLGPRANWSVDNKNEEVLLSAISDPAKAMLVMDFMRPNATHSLWSSSDPKDGPHLDASFARHNERVNIGYVAGNVATMDKADFIALRSSPSAENIRFWSGN